MHELKVKLKLTSSTVAYEHDRIKLTRDIEDYYNPKLGIKKQ